MTRVTGSDCAVVCNIINTERERERERERENTRHCHSARGIRWRLQVARNFWGKTRRLPDDVLSSVKKNRAPGTGRRKRRRE